MPLDGLDVYYTDFGLEKQGALPKGKVSPESHLARIKALLLISRSVCIPFSHLLSLSSSTFDTVVGAEVGLFREGMVRFKLSSDTSDIPSYIDKYSGRSNVNLDELTRKEKVLIDGGVAPDDEKYSGEVQSSIFRRIVGERLDALAEEFEAGDGYRVAKSILAISDGKEDFDAYIRQQFASSKTASDLKRLSDAAYYVVGAQTNGTAISENGFLTARLIRELGLQRHSFEGPLTGDSLNPSVFQTVLLYSGAIDSPLLRRH